MTPGTFCHSRFRFVIHNSRLRTLLLIFMKPAKVGIGMVDTLAARWLAAVGGLHPNPPHVTLSVAANDFPPAHLALRALNIGNGGYRLVG